MTSCFLTQRRRCRYFSCAILLFICLLCILSAAKVDELSENEAKGPTKSDASDEPHQQSSSNQNLPVHVLNQENGLYILSQVEHIPEALQPMNDGSSATIQPPLLVVALYEPTCSHSLSLIKRFERVNERIERYVDNLRNTRTAADDDTSSWTPPRLAMFDATLLDSSWIKTLEITAYPTMLWFVPSYRDDTESDDVYFMDYSGLYGTEDELYHSILHAYYRATVGSIWRVDAFHDVQTTLQRHASGLLHHVAFPINPDYTATEQETIRWLMAHDSNEEDPFVVFVQCQNTTTTTNNETIDSYNQHADVISNRHDVVFFAVEQNCDQEQHFQNTDTMVLYLSPRDVVATTTTSRKKKSPFNNNNNAAIHYRSNPTSIQQFVEMHATLSVLWFDRVSVAPIAFAAHNKIHAVLFVPLAREKEAKTAIKRFRSACQQQKQRHLVCLIVPHTERRIMTTFGIDIWTPLDDAVFSSSDDKQQVTSSVLPALLVTDQRYNGTLKYYLNSSSIVQQESSIRSFFDKFWKDQLTPFVPSSALQPRRNKSHVQIITGATFQSTVIDQTNKHTLVMLFAPTCGHCKRFSVLWNTLSRLIHYLEWDSFLDVCKMDITENQVITDRVRIDVQEVPDVYYFPRGDFKHQPVRYNVLDKFGDGAGRLRDPLDIIDWLVDVSNDPQLSENSLLKLMEKGSSDEQVEQESSRDAKPDQEL